MIDWGLWATLGFGFVGIAFTIVGTAIKLTWWLGSKLDEITSKQDERHAENSVRFAKLETAILNGYGKRRR